MKSHGGRRRAPALTPEESAFWTAFGKSLRGHARRRSRRALYRLLRRL